VGGLLFKSFSTFLKLATLIKVNSNGHLLPHPNLDIQPGLENKTHSCYHQQPNMIHIYSILHTIYQGLTHLILQYTIRTLTPRNHSLKTTSLSHKLKSSKYLPLPTTRNHQKNTRQRVRGMGRDHHEQGRDHLMAVCRQGAYQDRAHDIMAICHQEGVCPYVVVLGACHQGSHNVTGICPLVMLGACHQGAHAVMRICS